MGALTTSRKCRGVDLPDLERGVVLPDMGGDAKRIGRTSGWGTRYIYPRVMRTGGGDGNHIHKKKDCNACRQAGPCQSAFMSSP